MEFFYISIISLRYLFKIFAIAKFCVISEIIKTQANSIGQ